MHTNSNEAKKWPQILSLLVACCSAFISGAFFAWPSPSALVIIEDERYKISETEASYFSVVSATGTVLFSVLIINLMDFIGRKASLIFAAIPYAINWILIISSKSIYVIYTARIIGGCGEACLYSTLPIYLGEITVPEIRGVWGVSFPAALYTGQFAVTAIGSYLSIETTATIFLIITLIFAIVMVFMPETPYYYLMKEMDDHARKSLKFLRKQQVVEDELTEIKAATKRQVCEPGQWIDLVKNSANRRAITCGALLRFSQQLVGISAFISYNQMIFAKAGGDLSPQTSSVIFFALKSGGTFLCTLTIDRFGRRNCHIYSLAICAVFLFIESIYFYIDENISNFDISPFNWIPITGLVCYCISFSLGVGAVPQIMLGELFSSGIKGKALFIIVIVYSLSVLMTVEMFNILQNFGLYCPFLFFGVSSVICSILSVFVVPETKGKTLEEIQIDLKRISYL